MSTRQSLKLALKPMNSKTPSRGSRLRILPDRPHLKLTKDTSGQDIVRSDRLTSVHKKVVGTKPIPRRPPRGKRRIMKK